jgi:transitional endoplasmic reticulum ATPase
MTTQQAAAQDLVAAVALLSALKGGEPRGTVNIQRDGDQIILPKGMSYDEGITWLKRKKEEEEQTVNVHEEVDAFVLEGLVAFHKAIAKKYGWVGLEPTPGFFGPQPPTMIGVEVSPGTTLQVPWGRVTIPNVSGWLGTGFVPKGENRVIFLINGQVKRKNLEDVRELARLTREMVRQDSIYRGKAIQVQFPKPDSDFDVTACPKFLDLKGIREEELVFPDKIMEQVQTSLFNVIEHTDLCRKHQIPLKRGILLEGPYGTGKTLTAHVAAKKCEENQWTFIYLKDVDQLAQAVAFAQMYQPAMIFSEDIDQALNGERDSDMNQILNIVDGIDSKGTEIVIVLTTNYVERIDPAMLRPGRLDAVIPVRHPDASAAQRLIRLYGRGRIAEGEDLTSVGERLAGKTPAVLREVVERSKLAAVGRLARQGRSENELAITEADLLSASESIMSHLDLLASKKKDERTVVEQLGDSLGKVLVNRLEKANKDAENGKIQA